jgi:hypothetical protein
VPSVELTRHPVVVAPGLLAGLLFAWLAAPTLVHGESPSLHRIVAAGQPAPGGGTFEHFTIESQPVVAPVNAKGQIVFFATLLRAPAAEGLFLASGPRIDKVAVEGDRVPGVGTLSGFGRHPIPTINRAGSVAFAAAVSGGKTVEGIFVASRGRILPVARAGESAPGLPSGTLANLDYPALNDRGDVAFLATVRRGRETIEAIYLLTGGRLRKLVAQEDPAPAGGAFAGFGAPALNNSGAVAFGAVVEGPAVPGGVFIARDGRIRMLVGAGDETPLGGIFAKLSERVALDDAGTVAFTGVLKDAPVQAGVFVVEQTRLRKVVALGEAAPGGGTFANFGFWPVLGAAGTVAFSAAVDQGPASLAVFLAGPAGVRRLAAIGDPLPGGGKLASFGLYPSAAIGPTGQVTFATAPTATGEGSEGIFSADSARMP